MSRRTWLLRCERRQGGRHRARAMARRPAAEGNRRRGAASGFYRPTLPHRAGNCVPDRRSARSAVRRACPITAPVSGRASESQLHAAGRAHTARQGQSCAVSVFAGADLLTAERLPPGQLSILAHAGAQQGQAVGDGSPDCALFCAQHKQGFAPLPDLYACPDVIVEQQRPPSVSPAWASGSLKAGASPKAGERGRRGTTAKAREEGKGRREEFALLSGDRGREALFAPDEVILSAFSFVLSPVLSKTTPATSALRASVGARRQRYATAWPGARAGSVGSRLPDV